MSIIKLNQGAIALSSSIPFSDPSSGFDLRASVSDLLALLTAAGGLDGFVTQRFAPNGSGYTVLLTSPASGVPGIWALIVPLGAYAAMTLDLPVGVDGLEVLVSCTQAVTALTTVGATVGAGAQPVNGAPASLAANGFFRLRFDGVNGSWYRIG
jgi:hypothetical protein